MSYNRYFGNAVHLDSDDGLIAVALVNLGSPEAPNKRALKPYLREFLGDPRVIEIDPVKWRFILNFFILPFRPKRSAKLYERIWTRNGSPLLLHSRAQARALEKVLQERYGERIVVETAMRLGQPNIKTVFQGLRERGMTKLLVIPMFPQYSGTTTGSVFDGVADEFKNWRWVPELRMVNSFCSQPKYIQTIADSIKKLWDKEGKPEKLVLSFHGIPKRYSDNGDPYYCECQVTAEAIVEQLDVKRDMVEITFQSLFGKEEWLRPYTDEKLQELASSGIKRVDITCPGFTADCLETIDEINRESRHVFEEAGGEEYRYIPCVNARPDFIACLADLVETNLSGWL